MGKLLILASLALAACEPPTSFKGDAKYPDGVAGCRRACTADGLEFGGFVYSGQFATSCVCAPRLDPAVEGAQSSATAGVIIQTHAAAAAAAANNSQQLMMQQQQRQMSQPHS
jgi:hypothetical protein